MSTQCVSSVKRAWLSARKAARISSALMTSIALLTTLAASPLPAAAAQCTDWCYAGYFTNSTAWQGVDGYIRQSTTSPLSGNNHHADWISVCGPPSCGSNIWVQIGTYQGAIGGTIPNDSISSYSGVDVYTEASDQCQDRTDVDHNAPPQADYPYYVNYDGQGPHTMTCPSYSKLAGQQVQYYNYQFRDGSSNDPPIAYGTLSSAAGQVETMTELYDGPTTPTNTDYYGCSASLSCTTDSYGLHLYNGSAWLVWNANYSTSVWSPEGDPPYRHSYNTYWSWKTCGAPC